MLVGKRFLTVFRYLNQVKDIHIYKNLLSTVSFNLSDIGEGIREVVVKEWFVKPGDNVAQFDNICEVQSDKASVTITSRYDGIISKLYYNVDDTAFVGKPLVDIETESDSSSVPTTEKPPEPTFKTEEIFKNVSNTSDMQCIPSVRRLIKQYNLDINKIVGTGKNGRILKEDVLKYMEKPNENTSITTHIKDEIPVTEPIKGFNQAMVKTMTESLKIPHLVYGDDILLTQLSKLRKQLKMKHDTTLSSMPFIIKAVSNALTRHPILNSSLDKTVQNIIYHKAHNIAIAMDTEAGLAVPVIKDVQNKSIIEINTELQRLMAGGKIGKFSPDDLIGGTFTVSNVGPFGGTHMKPVILAPQVGLLAIGRSQVLPRFDESLNVVAEEVVTISAAGDHRIIAGAIMAKFCLDVKKQLENPYLLFLNI